MRSPDDFRHEAPPADVDRRFIGHPKALGTLFFLEFWERFSYYGMRAILVYFLYFDVARGGLGMDRPTAAALVSAYTALVYLFGVLGGWVADRLLGPRKTVLHGGITIMVGHIVLAVPAGLAGMYAGVLLIVIGTGLLKPNVSVMVNALYRRADPRRESGYALFYTGLSMGGFAGPIVVGWTQSSIGFHTAFATTAVGMAVGLAVYVVSGRRHFGSAGALPARPLAAAGRSAALRRGVLLLAATGVVVGLGTAAGLVTLDRVTDIVTVVAVGLPIVYFTVILRSPQCSADERRRMMAFIPLFLAVVMFALLSSQTFSILAIYAETRVDLDVFGWSVPPAWFGSIDLFLLMVLGPVFAGVWARLGHRQPATPRKFAVGIALAGASFLVAMLASSLAGPGGLVDALWLVGLYLLLACAELIISPVGAVATARLAPAAFSAQTMALWFLSGAAGNGIGIQVVTLYSPETEALYFGSLGAVAILAGAALFLATPLLRRLTGDLDYSGAAPAPAGSTPYPRSDER